MGSRLQCCNLGNTSGNSVAGIERVNDSGFDEKKAGRGAQPEEEKMKKLFLLYLKVSKRGGSLNTAKHVFSGWKGSIFPKGNPNDTAGRYSN